MKTWGEPPAEQLPLKVQGGGGWEAGGREGWGIDGALPAPPPETMGRVQGLESNRPASASQLCPF